MRIQWYMWVVLALILAPLVQQWIATYYPAESYPIAALIVVVIGGVAKWLELVLRDRSNAPTATDGPVAAAAPMTGEAMPASKARRLFWDA